MLTLSEQSYNVHVEWTQGSTLEVPRWHRRLTFGFGWPKRKQTFFISVDMLGMQDFMVRNFWAPHNFSLNGSHVDLFLDGVQCLPIASILYFPAQGHKGNCFYKTYFRTNTGFNLGLASSSESVYSSYSDDYDKITTCTLHMYGIICTIYHGHFWCNTLSSL